MRRRDEEKIIGLAFQDIPESEAARMEKQISSDPALARSLAQLKGIKQDLNLLKDIPAHQLSTERMKEAILRGGLKRQRRLANWSWSVVAGVTTAAALVLMLVRPQAPNQPVAQAQPQGPGEEIVAFAAPTGHENVFHTPTELTDLTHAVRSTYSYSDEAPAIETIDKAKPSHKKPHISHYAVPENQLNGELALDTSNQTGDPSQDPQQQVDTSNEPAAQAPTDIPTTLTADDTSSTQSGDAQKIIVVHDAQDKSTGAQQATEVEPTSNVVVGG